MAKKKNVRKVAKVTHRPAKAARKPARKAPARTPSGPAKVSTGGGATPLQIGQTLVSRFNAGQAQITDDLWSRDIESVEGLGVAQAWRGRKAVDAKNEWWSSDHVIHGASAEGPYVGATGFAVKFRIDAETKSTGKREWMEEVGVYTVRNGKIVREEFMYYSPAQAQQVENKPDEAMLARM